jgi:hypothetical protein
MKTLTVNNEIYVLEDDVRKAFGKIARSVEDAFAGLLTAAAPAKKKEEPARRSDKDILADLRGMPSDVTVKGVCEAFDIRTPRAVRLLEVLAKEREAGIAQTGDRG